jgi:serine acetyltransferase
MNGTVFNWYPDENFFSTPLYNTSALNLVLDLEITTGCQIGMTFDLTHTHTHTHRMSFCCCSY